MRLTQTDKVTIQSSTSLAAGGAVAFMAGWWLLRSWEALTESFMPLPLQFGLGALVLGCAILSMLSAHSIVWKLMGEWLRLK